MYEKFTLLKSNIKLISNVIFMLIGVVFFVKSNGAPFAIFLIIYGWTMAMDSLSSDTQTIYTRWQGHNIDGFILLGYLASAGMLIFVILHQACINLL